MREMSYLYIHHHSVVDAISLIQDYLSNRRFDNEPSVRGYLGIFHLAARENRISQLNPHSGMMSGLNDFGFP